MFLNFGNCNKNIIRYFTTTYHDIDQHCFPTHFPQISMVRIQMRGAFGSEFRDQFHHETRQLVPGELQHNDTLHFTQWRLLVACHPKRFFIRNLRWKKTWGKFWRITKLNELVIGWFFTFLYVFSLWKHLLTIACLAYYSLWQACVEESPWSSPGCALISPVTGKM